MAEAFAKQVRRAIQANDLDTLAGLFQPLEVDEALYAACQEQGNEKALQSSVQRVLSRDPDLANFVSAWLVFVRDGGYAADEGFLVSISCKKLEIAIVSARKILLGADSGWFIPVIRALSTGLVTLAFTADDMTADPQTSSASSAARALTLTLNGAATGDPGPKRQAVLHLANETLRIYFHLKNPRMGNTVVKNTGDAMSRMEDYPKADQVAFLYYTGRMSLFEKNLRRASDQLGVALNLCSKDAFVNCRQILTYLTAARLPLGIFPRLELLEEFNLDGPFHGLIEALKAGHYVQMVAELDAWRQWHISRGIYLLLREKLEILCWRNLVKRTLWLLDPPGQPGVSKPPALKLQLLLHAAQDFIDSEVDFDDVECMCASLIDQGYLKAYIHHATGQVVFQKFAPFGFPAVATINV